MMIYVARKRNPWTSRLFPPWTRSRDPPPWTQGRAARMSNVGGRSIVRLAATVTAVDLMLRPVTMATAACFLISLPAGTRLSPLPDVRMSLVVERVGLVTPTRMTGARI